MSRKNWVFGRDPENKLRGSFTLGDRNIQLPVAAIVSVTRGEGLNLFRMIVNAVANQFVMRQMLKTTGLLYAELTGDGRQGFGQTLTRVGEQGDGPVPGEGCTSFRQAVSKLGFLRRQSASLLPDVVRKRTDSIGGGGRVLVQAVWPLL